MAGRLLAMLIHIGFGVTCFTHIFTLRSWVHGSGWMSDLSVIEEGEPYNLGQLLPLLSIINIVVVGVEAIRSPNFKCPMCGGKAHQCKGCGYHIA